MKYPLSDNNSALFTVPAALEVVDLIKVIFHNMADGSGSASSNNTYLVCYIFEYFLKAIIIFLSISCNRNFYGISVFLSADLRVIYSSIANGN